MQSVHAPGLGTLSEQVTAELQSMPSELLVPLEKERHNMALFFVFVFVFALFFFYTWTSFGTGSFGGAPREVAPLATQPKTDCCTAGLQRGCQSHDVSPALFSLPLESIE